jgi:hypothetical protein
MLNRYQGGELPFPSTFMTTGSLRCKPIESTKVIKGLNVFCDDALQVCITWGAVNTCVGSAELHYLHESRKVLFAFSPSSHRTVSSPRWELYIPAATILSFYRSLTLSDLGFLGGLHCIQVPMRDIPCSTNVETGNNW